MVGTTQPSLCSGALAINGAGDLIIDLERTVSRYEMALADEVEDIADCRLRLEHLELVIVTSEFLEANLDNVHFDKEVGAASCVPAV